MFRGFTPVLFVSMVSHFIESRFCKGESKLNRIAVIAGWFMVSHPIVSMRNQYMVLPALTTKKIVPTSSYIDLMRNMVARRTFFTGFCNVFYW